jgi:hypothetical protein
MDHSFAVGLTNEFLSIWFWYELKKVHCFNKLAGHLSLQPSETCLPYYCSSQLELGGQGNHLKMRGFGSGRILSLCYHGYQKPPCQMVHDLTSIVDDVICHF